MFPTIRLRASDKGPLMITDTRLEVGDYIDAGGHRTHYHEAGTGETVVFVHGSGPGVTGWANWRNALPAFAERFHVLAPDVLGFGFSARPAGAAYGKDIWVDHLLAFLEAKGVHRCHLVGNSLGGALSLALAVREPQMVDRLVLMGAAVSSQPTARSCLGVRDDRATRRRASPRGGSRHGSTRV